MYFGTSLEFLGEEGSRLPADPDNNSVGGRKWKIRIYGRARWRESLIRALPERRLVYRAVERVPEISPAKTAHGRDDDASPQPRCPGFPLLRRDCATALRRLRPHLADIHGRQSNRCPSNLRLAIFPLLERRDLHVPGFREVRLHPMHRPL